ncbi:MAG TPA: AI-2E family transporter [Polyangia bacterium]|nr:AI-2E family transporter [Polyangia bacterium]
MKRVAMVTALVAGTLTTVSIVYRLRFVVALMALAIVLASAIRPLTASLIHHRVPRRLAMLLGYLVAASAPIALVALLVPSVANELTAALNGILPSYERHRAAWRAGGGRVALLAAWIPSASALEGVLSHVRPAVLVGGAWRVTVLVLEAALSGLLVVILSIAWTVHREPIVSGVAALIPARHRPFFRQLSSDLGVGVGLHVFGEACKSLTALALVALPLAALHAPSPILPAMLVAVLRLVPIAGVALSTLVVGVAMVPLGTAAALVGAPATWLLLLGLQHAMPRLLRSREYNPLLVAFVALLLASAIGWVGLMLAPAVAAAIQITIEAALHAREARAIAPASTADIRDRYELLAARALARKRTSRRTLGLLANLGALIGDVEGLERGNLPPAGSHVEHRAA